MSGKNGLAKSFVVCWLEGTLVSSSRQKSCGMVMMSFSTRPSSFFRRVRFRLMHFCSTGKAGEQQERQHYQEGALPDAAQIQRRP